MTFFQSENMMAVLTVVASSWFDTETYSNTSCSIEAALPTWSILLAAKSSGEQQVQSKRAQDCALVLSNVPS